MKYVKVPAPAGLEDVFPDGVELREDLAKSGNKVAINKAIMELGGRVIPTSEWNRRVQFAKGFTDTGRGILESVGVMDQDLSQEMRDRMIRENDPLAKASYYAGAVAEFIPATAIKALTVPFQAIKNPVLRTALEFGAVGGAIGTAQPVYEQLGDDRLTNAMLGAGVGLPLGGLVGQLTKHFGAKTEEEFVKLWDEASPALKQDIERKADQLALEAPSPKELESPDAMYERKQADAANARQEDGARQAELDAIRAQGDAAGSKIREAQETARIKSEFEQNLAAQQQATANASKKAEYDAQVKKLVDQETDVRLKELQGTMKSILAPRNSGSYTPEIKSATARLTRWQKQIDSINAGDKNKGTGGRGINALRAERDKALADLETTKALQLRAAEREAAVKEYVQLKKNGKSETVFNRVDNRIKELEQPEVKQPQAPQPEAVDPATLQAIPEGMLRPTPPQANAGTGRVERLGTNTRRAVDRGAYEAQQASVQEALARQAQEAQARAAQGSRPAGGAVGGAVPPVPPRSNVPPQGGASYAKQSPLGEAASTARQGLDYVFGNVLTAMRKISPLTAERMTRYDFNKAKRITQNSNVVEGFARQFRDMSSNLRSQVNAHLMSGEFDEAVKLMTPSMKAEFNKVKGVLIRLNKEAKAAGIEVPNIKNYFPRKVKEGKLKALRAALGREDANAIQDNLQWWANKNGFDTVADIPEEKQIDIINQTLRGIFRGEDAGKVSFQKARTVKKIDPELEQFYEDSVDSLLGYIEKSSRAIETAKFFGRRKDVSRNSDGEAIVDNKSIGAVLQEAIIKENLTDRAKIEELQELLRTRFAGEVNSPNKFWGGVRDIGYIDTIGDVISAFKQVQDLAQSARKYGIGNTIAAAFNTKNLNAVDLGIENAIAHELQNGRRTAKLLQGVFNKSGFNFIDRLGKETIANAAHRKHVALLKTPKGEAKFRKMYKEQLGDAMEQTIKDIKDGKFTDDVQFLAYNNVQDLQPINTTNMPPLYSNLKNGRVAYMLKSFTLKQFDIVRREVVQEAAKGNIGEASKNMFMISTYLMAAGVPTTVAVDWVLGREIRMEDLPDRAMWSLLGVFGMNAYLWDRYLSAGNFTEGAANVVTPPMGTATLPYRAAAEAFKEEPSWDKFLKDVPILGTLLYNRLGTGAERYNERLDN